jgi:hypothetical protein
MRIHLLTLAALIAGLPACGTDRPAATPGDSTKVAPPPAAATNDTSPGADSAAAISGADGVAFGTTRERILADRGQSEYTNDDHEGAQSIGFSTKLLDQPAQIIFLVHPEHGMMRASYMVPVENVERCQLVLSMVEQGLARKYGALRVTPPRTPVATACTAFAQGTPWMQRWTDAGDREIMLALLPGTPGVMVTYTTPEAAEWESGKISDQL